MFPSASAQECQTKWSFSLFFTLNYFPLLVTQKLISQQNWCLIITLSKSISIYCFQVVSPFYFLLRNSNFTITYLPFIDVLKHCIHLCSIHKDFFICKHLVFIINWTWLWLEQCPLCYQCLYYLSRELCFCCYLVEGQSCNVIYNNLKLKYELKLSTNNYMSLLFLTYLLTSLACQITIVLQISEK